MTTERLRNRLAKVEELSAPQSYAVYYEGESALDVHCRAGGLGRPVVLMPRPLADAAEWLRKLWTARCVISRRVPTLEAGTVGAVTVRDAIDRPPRETRDEWPDKPVFRRLTLLGARQAVRRATSGSPAGKGTLRSGYLQTLKGLEPWICYSQPENASGHTASGHTRLADDAAEQGRSRQLDALRAPCPQLSHGR